jgi:hypothetical protein
VTSTPRRAIALLQCSHTLTMLCAPPNMIGAPHCGQALLSAVRATLYAPHRMPARRPAVVSARGVFRGMSSMTRARRLSLSQRAMFPHVHGAGARDANTRAQSAKACVATRAGLGCAARSWVACASGQAPAERVGWHSRRPDTACLQGAPWFRERGLIRDPVASRAPPLGTNASARSLRQSRSSSAQGSVCWVSACQPPSRGTIGLSRTRASSGQHNRC